MSMNRTSATNATGSTGGTGGATERLVVIGGDAAGMSAASQARRLQGPGELEIVAFERGHFTSYSACGIPYWVGGDVAGPDELIARTPAGAPRARTSTCGCAPRSWRSTSRARRVRARDLERAPSTWTSYDQLVIATGARPVRPDLPGDRTRTACTACRPSTTARRCWTTLAATRGRRAVVVGAGYIGVEMAEALISRGLRGDGRRPRRASR